MQKHIYSITKEKIMMKRVMVIKYGFIDLDAKTDEEAIEKAKNLQDSDFDWSDFDEPKVIDDLDE